MDWSGWDRNSTSWLGSSCDMGLTLWALSKYFLGFLFGDEVILDFFYINWG